jgi:hypothetical protein
MTLEGELAKRVLSQLRKLGYTVSVTPLPSFPQFNPEA